MNARILTSQLLKAFAIGEGDDAVMPPKSDIHSPRPILQRLRNFANLWPTQPMSPPSSPNHHSHFVIGNMKGTETVQMRRDDAPLQKGVADAKNKIGVPINGKP